MIRILASSSPGEVRVAVLCESVLTEYALWRPGCPDGLGDIHLARIETTVPAMAGAFAAIGGATGFLPDSDGAAGRAEGSLLCVRIVRTAQGGKGPRLSEVPADAGDLPLAGLPRLLRRAPGPLHRLAAAYPDAAIVVDDAALLATLRPSMAGRLSLAAAAFDDALADEVEALSSPFAALPGGLRASIVPTPALIAIDVDGGSSTAAAGEKSRMQMTANRAAILALVRQITLRSLSGAIVIDFAGIPARRRAALAPDLKAALAADRARPRLLGFSHLGFAEILRPRGAAPLHEQLAGPHAAGLAALRAVAANPSARPVLRAAPAVVAALQADAAALPDLARRLVHPLVLRSDPSLPAQSWMIEDQA